MRTLAVAVAGLAGALAVGGRRNLVLARLTCSTASERRASATARGANRRVRPGVPGLSPRGRAAAVVASCAVAGLAIGGPAFAMVAGAAAGLVAATRFRTISARRHRDTETAVSEACLLLAAELRSGAHPRQAVTAVAAEWPELFGAAARRAEVGGDVASALRETAQAPGRAALTAVAVGWEVSERTGSALPLRS